MLSHIDNKGNAKMVDVKDKVISNREAKAFAKVTLTEAAFDAVKSNSMKKGDALAVARIAGIQAAKKTSELIPLCHNIFLSSVDVDFKLNDNDFSIEIFTSVKSEGKTGVEMEALTSASVAALTIYDMCKAVDKGIIISDVKLLSKSGGKSGDYIAGDLKKK
jgi:molybdenum cofactor biosynthesis protein MoaC